MIALVWTLLKQGPQGRPAARRVIVVTPSSLTHNWAAEAQKWLGAERLKVMVMQPGAEAQQQVWRARLSTKRATHALPLATCSKLRATACTSNSALSTWHCAGR